MTQWLGQVVMLTTASGIVPALTTAHYVDDEQSDIGADSADSVDLLTLGSSSTQFTKIPRITAPSFVERLFIAPGYYFVGEAGDTSETSLEQDSWADLSSPESNAIHYTTGSGDAPDTYTYSLQTDGVVLPDCIIGPITFDNVSFNHSTPTEIQAMFDEALGVGNTLVSTAGNDYGLFNIEYIGDYARTYIPALTVVNEDIGLHIIYGITQQATINLNAPVGSIALWNSTFHSGDKGLLVKTGDDKQRWGASLEWRDLDDNRWISYSLLSDPKVNPNVGFNLYSENDSSFIESYFSSFFNNETGANAHFIVDFGSSPDGSDVYFSTVWSASSSEGQIGQIRWSGDITGNAVFEIFAAQNQETNPLVIFKNPSTQDAFTFNTGTNFIPPYLSIKVGELPNSGDTADIRAISTSPALGLNSSYRVFTGYPTPPSTGTLVLQDDDTDSQITIEYNQVNNHDVLVTLFEAVYGANNVNISVFIAGFEVDFQNALASNFVSFHIQSSTFDTTTSIGEDQRGRQPITALPGSIVMSAQYGGIYIGGFAGYWSTVLTQTGIGFFNGGPSGQYAHQPNPASNTAALQAWASEINNLLMSYGLMGTV